MSGSHNTLRLQGSRNKPDSKKQLSDLSNLHRSLQAKASGGRRRNNIDRLYEALMHIHQSKSVDYSISNVARVINQLGHTSPKEQTIRNAEGIDFREMIAAFREAFGTFKAKAATDRDNDLAAGLPDIKTRARVEWLVEENKILKRRLDLLHNLVRTMEPVHDVALTDGTRLQLAPAHATSAGEKNLYTDIEQKSVRAFISNVDEIGCVFDERSGALIMLESGLEIAPPRFLHVLNKVLAKM
jgi:hypothetical protein